MKIIEFETAVELKNAGFDLPVIKYFTPKGYTTESEDYQSERLVKTNWNNGEGSYPTEAKDVECSAPYQYEVVDWLRNRYKIHISVYPSDNINKEWYCEIEDLWLTNGFNTKTRSYFKSLEGALEAGILEAIKLIP